MGAPMQDNKDSTFITLKEVQPILTNATTLKNSDWSFNMGVCEKFCFTILYFSEKWVISLNSSK